MSAEKMLGEICQANSFWIQAGFREPAASKQGHPSFAVLLCADAPKGCKKTCLEASLNTVLSNVFWVTLLGQGDWTRWPWPFCDPVYLSYVSAFVSSGRWTGCSRKGYGLMYAPAPHSHLELGCCQFRDGLYVFTGSWNSGLHVNTFGTGSVVLECLWCMLVHAGIRDARAPRSILPAQWVLTWCWAKKWAQRTYQEVTSGRYIEAARWHAAVGSFPPLPMLCTPAVWLCSSGTEMHHLELVKIVLVS